MSILHLFRPKGKPLRATHIEHYERVKRSAGGAPRRLSLIEARTEGQYVTLVYQWKEQVTDEEADRIDTRVRAYMTCAIYDAAIAVGLSCHEGPPHGQRPAWIIEGSRSPTTLAQAGFDTTKRICWLQIGPGFLILDQARETDPLAQKLARAFKRHFAEITV